MEFTIDWYRLQDPTKTSKELPENAVISHFNRPELGIRNPVTLERIRQQGYSTVGRLWYWTLHRTRRLLHTTDKVIEFLRDLLKHLRGQVVVVWDRGSNHKGPLMRKFLSRNRRLTLEMLPPWAPELNPVEPIWSWLKYGELANFVPHDTDVLDDEILDRIVGLKFEPELLRALWVRSELPFPVKRSE